MTDAFGGRGGIAQYNRDLLGALAACSAMSAITVLPRGATDPVVVPATINQKKARPGKIAYSAFALGAAVSLRVDIVFCGHLYLAPLAWFIARLRGARLIIQIHGVEAWPRPSWMQRVAVEAADLVLSVSRYTRTRVLGWAAIAPERVLVVPDTVGDQYTPGDGGSLRTALGLDGKRVLLTVGRMDARERYKGQDRVIAAIPMLVAQGHDVIAVMIGEGDDRARLEQLAEAMGVAERVKLLGIVAPQPLAEAYRMADLFVMPSTGEGFGIAFLEALASGTPALGLPVAGTRDALADGDLGSLVPEDDLPAAIGRILAAPRPNSQTLTAATRARFGRDVFQARVSAAMDRVLPRVATPA